MTPLLVIVGAMIGAPARYLTDRLVQARHESVFPWGTFTVNIVGSFILGFMAAASTKHGLPEPVLAFAGTGFCGALTTYSTFSYETVRLLEDRSRFYALANVIASIIAGLGSALCGAALSTAL
jgi:fluoride exporter